MAWLLSAVCAGLLCTGILGTVFVPILPVLTSACCLDGTLRLLTLRRLDGSCLVQANSWEGVQRAMNMLGGTGIKQMDEQEIYFTET